MNQMEKDAVRYFRLEGLGYKTIASRLHISENTIKSFCRRNGLTKGLPPKDAVCRYCGVELHHVSGRRAKKYCSAACRSAWWSTHPHLMDRTIKYTANCAHCDKSFDSYSSASRKYCSRGCYMQARFGKGADIG